MTGVAGPRREDRAGVWGGPTWRNAARGTHSPSHAVTRHAAPASTVQSAVLFTCLRGMPVRRGMLAACSGRGALQVALPGTLFFSCQMGTAPQVSHPATCPLSGAGQGRAGQSGVLWGPRYRKTLSRASGILAASPKLPGSWGLFCWH